MENQNCTASANPEDGLGRLPAYAPLANPYVPFQPENPVKYDAQLALVRGTLFPGLDLPFRNMVNDTPLPQSLSSNLQVLAFAVQELALYLDTHREDQEALALYRQYQQLLRQAKEAYSLQKGPLNHASVSDSEEYAWLDDPWPWEYGKKQED